MAYKLLATNFGTNRHNSSSNKALGQNRYGTSVETVAYHSSDTDSPGKWTAYLYFASTKFIERRGRFPSPILALRN